MQAPPSLSLSEWPDLPPDVLRDISGRLLDAADLVRFHAVCKPWRDIAGTARRSEQSLLPWLLASDKMNPLSIFLDLRCVFSRRSYWSLLPFSVRRRNWVASADGTGVWYFTERPSPSLRDPLTGAVTLLLPPFPRNSGRWEGRSPGGVVYSDGTVLLYNISDKGDATKFRAALLCPGDAGWTVVERTFMFPDVVDLYAAYHRGKILVTVDDPYLTPDDEVGSIGDVLAVTPRPWMPCEVDDYFYEHNYVLESRGELLCVSIYIKQNYADTFGGKASVAGLVRALSVSVHALEEEDEESAPGKMRWVRKDGRALADRVLFLGWPNSFALEASRISGEAGLYGEVVSGGCAYFVYHDVGVIPNQPGHVFRYNLVDDKAKFVERLPQGWSTDLCMWLFPQPFIAPTEEIIDRLEGRKWWKKKKPHMAPTPRTNIDVDIPEPQGYNPYFRVCVRNLPRKVDRFQLHEFFSKHGKVSSANVLSKRKNKMSKKIGIVTIATVEERGDAIAALNGLVFNGCILEVKLVRSWKGRRASSAGSHMHSPDPLIRCQGIGLLLLVMFVVYLIY